MTEKAIVSGTGNVSTFGKFLYPLVTSVIFIFSLVTDWYIVLSRLLLLVTVVMVLNRLGKGIILRELIALHSLVVCLFMPSIGYTLYNNEHALAKLWVRYMPIPAEQYFGYALPAMTLFVTVLCWPILSQTASDQGTAVKNLLERAKKKLQSTPRTGFYLMTIGTITSFISPYLPGSLQFVATLFYWSAFAGVLYIYYTRSFKYKNLILAAFVFFLFVSALQGGMFTILVYMGITMFSFLFLGKKTAFWRKLLVFVAGIFVVFMIQSVKATFRKATWRQEYQGSKVSLFATLVTDRLTDTKALFDDKSFFAIYYRTNQGFNVALVMRRFPTMKPFDNGSILFTALGSSLVPRVLWPNKPEAGGRFNMEYYTGIVIKNWSTNVGPLGEAYGSFGSTGGIIFMFVLGAFIRWAYSRIFVIATRLPLLLFWIPVLFYQVTYSAETDTLQICNSLFKSAFFLWMLYKIAPSLFGAVKAIRTRARTHFQRPALDNRQQPM